MDQTTHPADATTGDKKIPLPVLNADETYIGLIGNAAGEAYHLILLPGDNDDATHEAALEWAYYGLKADLPNRIEQAMLWAHHKDLFQKDWYWSNETHHADQAYAWIQSFRYGGQFYDCKSSECRARAVRRLIL